jgi:hypothetical protein
MDPDTANEEKSIWNGVDRADLETHSIHLEHPNPQHAPSRASYDVNGAEFQIAQAFACISSYEPGPSPIAAATVDIDSINKSTKIVLAMNHGIPTFIRDGTTLIVKTMEQCAKTSLNIPSLWVSQS